MLYLNEEVPCNSFPIVLNPEIICIKSHQLKPKWLLLGCYKSQLWLTPMEILKRNLLILMLLLRLK